MWWFKWDCPPNKHMFGYLVHSWWKWWGRLKGTAYWRSGVTRVNFEGKSLLPSLAQCCICSLFVDWDMSAELLLQEYTASLLPCFCTCCLWTLEIYAPNKHFLLWVAWLKVFYYSNKKGTNTEFQLFTKFSWYFILREQLLSGMFLRKTKDWW